MIDEQTLQKIVWCSSGTAQRAIMFGRWNAQHRFWYGSGDRYSAVPKERSDKHYITLDPPSLKMKEEG